MNDGLDQRHLLQSNGVHRTPGSGSHVHVGGTVQLNTCCSLGAMKPNGSLDTQSLCVVRETNSRNHDT